MRDIWEDQLNWIESEEPFVLARVIRTWRSAPRKSGAGMLIGKGMDKDLILAKAIKNELVPTNKINHLTDEEIFDFIFHPGFSTAEEVTSVSGRGVGMDVVLTNVLKLGGDVKIKTEQGKGTEFSIYVAR